MKKSKVVIIALLLSAVTAAAVCLPKISGDADAVSVKQNMISEDFNTELSGDWTLTGGAQLDEQFSSLRLIGPDVWQPAVILQNETAYVDEERTVSFEMQLVSGNSWLGLVIGAPASSSAFYEANNMLMIANEEVQLWRSEDNRNLVEDTAEKYKGTPMTDAASGKVSVVARFVPDGDSHASFGKSYDMYLSWGAKGEEQFKKQYKVYADGYFGFCGQNGLTVDIFDFAMTDADGQTVFEDDFSDPSISYPSDRNSAADWSVTHLYGPDKVYMGYQKNLLFTSSGDAAVINLGLAADPRSEQSFEMSFRLQMPTAPERVYFGVGLGLKKTSDSIDSVNMIGFEKSGSSVKPVLIINGVVQENAERVFDATDCTVTLTGYYDGRVDVKVNSATRARFSGVDFEGYAAVGIAGTGAVSAAVDDLSLSIFTYQTSGTPDSAQDFAGVREFEDFGDTYYEHYINTERWLVMGTGVTFPLQYQRKYLNFSDATGNTAFGLKERYSEYILRFTVTNTKPEGSTKRTAPIAVSFGREYIDSELTESPAVIFNDLSGSMSVSALNATGGTFASDVNFYADDETRYQVMIIVAGREIKVYFKSADAPESDMGILRAHYTDVNTYGYVAVTCDTRDGKVGNFRLTDFSVVNIAPAAEEVTV